MAWKQKLRGEVLWPPEAGDVGNLSHQPSLAQKLPGPEFTTSAAAATLL